MSEELSVEKLQEMITRAPYHKWLGLQVLGFTEDSIDVKATWREEWVVNVEARYTHGGILAALIDLVADWALAGKLGRAKPTIDMRVDYHRPAMPGDLIVKGKVVKLGKQFSTCDAAIYDLKGQLLASGRGTYLTVQT
jgi:uncharacterized protein (TIGR00369 family)